MSTNDTNKKIIHKELSYKLVGLFFEIHNALGRFCKEKQYGDALEELLKSKGHNIRERKKYQFREFLTSLQIRQILL